MINLQAAVVLVFERRSAQLSSKADQEQPEYSYHCQSCERCISLVVTLLDQQTAQSKKAKEHNIRSNCKQQQFCPRRTHQQSSDQQKILKEQSAQTTPRVVSVQYCLWLPFSINSGQFNLSSVIYDQSVDSSCFALAELISTAQIKGSSSKKRLLKALLELSALHISCGYPSPSTESST